MNEPPAGTEQIPGGEKSRDIKIIKKPAEDPQQSDNPNPANAGERMVNEKKMTVDELRRKLPHVWAQYRFAVDELDLYLPEWPDKRHRKKWVTEKYLIDAILERIFTIKKGQIKEPGEVNRKYSKWQIQKYLEKAAGKDLGFKMDQEPPKPWMIKVLYSLDPNHKIFKATETNMERTIPETVYDKLKKKPDVIFKGARTFPMTEKERELKELVRIEESELKLKDSVEKTEASLEKKKQKIEELAKLKEKGKQKEK